MEEETDMTTLAAVYEALVKGEEAKRVVISQLAALHAGKPLGDQLAGIAADTQEIIEGLKEAAQACRERAGQPEDLFASLSVRTKQLFLAMQLEQGEWTPRRGARAVGGITDGRAHQIMKKLAEFGLTEQVRPRAHTYRLTQAGIDYKVV